jgi:hypothetical protein
VRLTDNLVELTKAARARQVVVDVELDHSYLFLIVGNLGPGGVTNVRLRVNEVDLVWRGSSLRPGGIQEVPVVKEGLPFLDASRTLRYVIGAPDWKAMTDAPSRLDFHVSYTDSLNQSHSRQITVDLQAYRHALPDRRPEDVLAEAIANAVDRLMPNPVLDSIKRSFGTRECPSCAERIPAKARKCPRCLEFIAPAGQEAQSESTTALDGTTAGDTAISSAPRTPQPAAAATVDETSPRRPA